MVSDPLISICVPIHEGAKHGDYFLWRLVQSVMKQTYKNYEIVITQEGSMPVNTNATMKKAKGDLIKIIYSDDYLAHENALQVIVDNIGDSVWLATGCLHQKYEPDYFEEPHSPHLPSYTHDIHTGNNQIGSPSVMTFRRNGLLFFDENLSFLLDCDLYKRYYLEYGEPKLINDLNVVIGLHPGQTSNTMPNEEKLAEFNYLAKKYGK